MKRSQFPIYALAGMTLFSLLTACGKMREGKYQGFEYAIMNDQRMGSQTVMIELKESGSELVTGTWQSASSSGSFQGFLRGDRIENIELQRGVATQSNTSGTLPMASDPCQGRYVGALSLSDNRINGKLTWSAGFGLMNGSMTGYSYTSCSAIEVDVAKLSN